MALFDTLVLIATAAADVQICLDDFVFLSPVIPQVSGASVIATQLINGPCITIPSTVQNVLPQTPEGALLDGEWRRGRRCAIKSADRQGCALLDR